MSGKVLVEGAGLTCMVWLREATAERNVEWVLAMVSLSVMTSTSVGTARVGAGRRSRARGRRRRRAAGWPMLERWGADVDRADRRASTLRGI